jgi:GSH-dependent disulfide-bond oxidoreductase
MQEASVSSIPDDYQVPRVWKYNADIEEEGQMMNSSPTSGARFRSILPVGKHSLQLYSLGTPNGMKVTILLEELNDIIGLEYDAWRISIMEMEQFGSGFVDVNPNAKIPALMDNSMSPPLRVFESCNILRYIAEKYNRFIPADFKGKTECFNWLFWQASSAPFLGGGFGHFYKYAPIKIEYAINRYTLEAKRQLDLLNKHLSDKKWMCGEEYSIADIAVYPWIYCLERFLNANEFLSMKSYVHLMSWCEQMAKRPAVKRGMRVNGIESVNAVAERHSRGDFCPVEQSSDYPE